MLKYRRKNSTTIVKEVSITSSNNSLITYCNWSYASQYHIDENTLVNILNTFNSQYVPFYLRIFNEAPAEILIRFIESHNINMHQIQIIHNQLNNRDGLRVKELLVA